MSFLIDTNVISESGRPRPNEQVLAWLSHQDYSRLYISVLTLGEIKRGAERLTQTQRKTRILEWLEDVRMRFSRRILSLSEESLLIWGKMYADFERRGVVRPVFDSLLEATALEYDLILVTRNVRNFRDSSVTIFNPWEDA